MKKLLATVGAILATLLGVVVLVVVGTVVLLSSGALNSQIEDVIAAEAGRPAQLEQAPSLGYEDGAVTVRLGPLSVANAEWAADRHADFARVEEVRASLRLLPLLRGRIELPEVEVASPQLHLARSEQGEPNWPEDEEDGPPPQVPRIERLVVRDATITYADAVAGIDTEVALDEASGRLGGSGDLALQATGRLEDAPLELQAAGGSLEALLSDAAMTEPATLEATIGGSRISANATSFTNLEALDARIEIDAEQALTEVLADMGIATAELPPFQATATVEPGDGASRFTADLEMEGASAHAEGEIEALEDPLQGFSADVSLQGSRPADLLALAGIDVPGELPGFELSTQVTGSDGTYQLEQLDARLGENTVTGQASVRYRETLESVEADLDLEAPELSSILASFEVPYADKVPSAQLSAQIAHGGNETTVALDGTVGSDSIELQGGYQGAITAFANPHADLHLEGSALGALPAEFGFATRPIESYRISAKVEERSDAPSPVNLDVTIENTRLRFDGSVDELRALKGIEGEFHAQGPDPAAVLELFKLPSISLPPYDVGGQVSWRDNEAKVTGLGGTVGDSDISGDAAIDLREEPPAVTAKLHSDLLDLDDFAGLVGAPPATGPGETASPAQEQRAEQAEQDDRLLPTKEIDPDLWRGANLDVELDADRIESTLLPIDRIEVHVVSKDGWLTVDPLVTGLADGSIVGFASLDATQDPLVGRFDIRIDALQLQDMLAKVGVSGEAFGEINGRIRLEGQGLSVDRLAGTADGQIVLTMNGGGLDALIVEAIGLDIAESIVVLLDSMAQTEQDKTPIRCAIVNLEVDQGIAKTSPVVIDTVDSKIIIDGQVNLRDETLDIFIEAQPKDPSLFSANQPLHVDGPILSPSVNPAPGRTESEPLGWLLAPLAALPFFDIGAAEDSPCGSLIAQAKEAATEQPQ